MLAAAVAEVVDTSGPCWTTVPAFLISIGIYRYGVCASGEIDMTTVNTNLEAISKTFNTNPVVLVRPRGARVAYMRYPPCRCSGWQ